VATIVKVTQLYKETYSDKVVNDKIATKIKDFVKTKLENPLQPFGASDKPFLGAGHFRNAVPGESMCHAHITHNLAIIYSISGKDPRVLKLYGLFNHDEMGIGQPPNIKKQKSLSQKIANQA